MAKLNLTSTLLFLALTFYFSSASALADLKVLGQLQVNPTQVYIGDAIQIDLSINNSGDQSSSYGYVKFFLSTNSTYSSNDIYIGQKYVSSISAGNTVNISHSQTMSSSLNAGNYYLIAFVDANHNTNESNENNNTKYKYISLLEKQPDLFVENRTVSKNTLTKGESFNVSCVVKNYGNATASSSYVGYYLSTNTTLSSNDIFLGKSYLSTVYAGSTRSTSKYVSIPTTVNKGTYYILYKADEDGTVSESDENNNVGNEKIFVIAPDLITSAITVSNGTLNPGQSVTVDATVKNIGDADAGTSRLKYYWSKNSVWDANDTYLGQDYISSLSQNDTESESLNFSVPSNATDGYWYVIAKADANEDVAENSETNNTKYKRVTVVVPKPDLRVLAPALTPSPVEAGSSMSLTIDVSNIGDVSSPSTKVKYYLSTNAYWNASDIYLGESSVSSLSVGNTTTLNKTVTIPSNTSIGTKYIIYFVDEPNSIVEKSESNNKTYKSFLVHKLQPDLVVQSLTLDKSQVIPGNSISIDCNVKNIGNSGAGSSYLKYYWSTNTVLDANDILIGDDYVSSLSAGALSSESINFTVPSNTTAGTYYVLCIADANSSVTEKNENNNKTTRSIQVYIPTPDLRITSQKLNNSSSTIYAKPGEQVTVESIVRNYGNGPAGSCKISYYLSTNNSYSSNDIFLKDENVGTLQPSSNQTITSTLTIPSNTTAGGRYIIGYVDSDFDVAESYESNNTRSTYFIVYIPEPDYVMTAMTLDQSTYIPGDNMSIECKVKNQGNKSGGSSTVKYYFSNNSILDASDTYIESDNVSGLAAGDISPSETINFTLPSNTTAGTKYIIFEADANNDVSEKNESNNIGKKSFQVTIPKPDLRVISPTITPLSVEAGDNLNISATVKNFGNLGSSSTKLKYYLSYNSSWSSNDIYLGESSVSGLSVGSDQTINATVTVPQTTSLGTQYIIFYVDKDDNIDELSESNNWASKHFYVVLVDPDLIATKLTIDTNTTTLATGTPLKITCDVKNIGNEDAPSSRLRYYWSTNTIVDANDIQIGSDYISSLDIDSSETESVNFTIPTNNAAGTHYIIGLADADSTVTEKNESNNRTYKKITVYIPTPDLKIIKQIPSPTTVSPGDQVSMESIVYNSGTGASNSSTDVSYYFSTNSTLSSNDIYLGKGTVSSLARWGRDTVVKSITIPNSATTGNYYIIAYVDSTLNINELYETNNHRATPIAINIPRPDYRVINTLLSESYVIPGDTINISCKVRNYGDKDGGSSTLKYYLSDNSSLDVTTDTYIGSDFVKALDIDSSSYEEIDFIVPNGLSAGKKWIFYVCDANEDVTERYENNNRSSRTFTLSIPKPDLRVSAKSLTPHTIAPGEDLDLTATIKNFGNGHALNTSNLKYFLSTNSSYSSNDILLDQSTISALGTNSDETAKKTVTIPTSTTDGTRYIIFYADHDDDVDESNESNNWTSLSFKVHTPEPDLVVEKIDLDQSGYYQGDAMSIDVTVKNIGDWAAGSSEVKVYLSSNSSLGSTDFFIGSGSISSLQSGDDDIHTHSFTIPNTVGNGKWYIIAKCDADDDVAEDNENNNVRAQIFDVFPDKPDLKPISISISPNANNLTAGQSVNLSATVKNIGSANAGSSWVDYYLSTDSIYSSNDIYMDYDYLPALNAGDDYDIIDNFFLPSNITGNMYLLVAVDVYDNRVNESNEGNNVISLPVVISSSGAGKMANEDGSIPNQELQFEFETFPNPFSQILNIDLKNISDHNSFINILDARGKVVHQQTGNTNRITIDLSELSKGMYTLQVINNGQVKNDRIIKH